MIRFKDFIIENYQRDLLTELSPATLNSYRKQAKSQLLDMKNIPPEKQSPNFMRVARNRWAGFKLANQKIDTYKPPDNTQTKSIKAQTTTKPATRKVNSTAKDVEPDTSKPVEAKKTQETAPKKFKAPELSTAQAPSTITKTDDMQSKIDDHIASKGVTQLPAGQLTNPEDIRHKGQKPKTDTETPRREVQMPSRKGVSTSTDIKKLRVIKPRDASETKPKPGEVKTSVLPVDPRLNPKPLPTTSQKPTSKTSTVKPDLDQYRPKPRSLDLNADADEIKAHLDAYRATHGAGSGAESRASRIAFRQNTRNNARAQKRPQVDQTSDTQRDAKLVKYEAPIPLMRKPEHIGTTFRVDHERDARTAIPKTNAGRALSPGKTESKDSAYGRSRREAMLASMKKDGQ